MAMRYVLCPFLQSRDGGIKRNLNQLQHKIYFKHDDRRGTLQFIKLNQETQNPLYKPGESLFSNAETNLSHVKAGDIIYLLAHGDHTNETFGSSREKVKPRLFIFPDRDYESMTVEQLVALLIRNGLSDGSSTDPIYIRLIVCNAGGPKMSDELIRQIVGDRYNPKDDLDFNHYNTSSPLFDDYITKHQDHIMARQVAIEFYRKGLLNVRVGGYPGELDILDGKAYIYATWNGISQQVAIKHAMLWFDGQGRVIRNKGGRPPTHR